MKLRDAIKKYVPYNEKEEIDKENMLKFIEIFDDVLTRNNTVGHFCSSAWIVNKDRTKVLMVYHNIYDTWVFPGGHCDGDEDTLAVALREVEEETGVKNIKILSENIFTLEIIEIARQFKNGKQVSAHLHPNVTYLFEVDEKEELKIQPDENKGVKWIQIDKIFDDIKVNWMKEIAEKSIEKVKSNRY